MLRAARYKIISIFHDGLHSVLQCTKGVLEKDSFLYGHADHTGWGGARGVNPIG